MKESKSLEFLYNTGIGRSILKILVDRRVSCVAGHFLSSGLSCPLIPYYIKKYNMDLTNAIDTEYCSFNEFFMRRNRFLVDEGEKTIVSPCEAYLSAYSIDSDSHFHIKHVDYDLSRLLRDGKLSEKFNGGTCLIFRLEPTNYHRYIYPVKGRIRATMTIDGVLHTVRPIATDSLPVFIENSREYTIIDSSIAGRFVQMEVGALLVGKIVNEYNGHIVRKGEEKGHFEFGGSTIMLLFEKGAVSLCDKIANVKNTGEEISVNIGEAIAQGTYNKDK